MACVSRKCRSRNRREIKKFDRWKLKVARKISRGIRQSRRTRHSTHVTSAASALSCNIIGDQRARLKEIQSLRRFFTFFSFFFTDNISNLEFVISFFFLSSVYFYVRRCVKIIILHDRCGEKPFFTKRCVFNNFFSTM